MGFKGYSSSRKVDGSEVAFVTVEPIRTEQHGLSVLAHSFVRSVINDAAEAGSASGQIVATGHVAQKGDVINVTSGAFSGAESKVVRADANNIYLADAITLAAADTFEILRHKYPKVAADGGIGVTITPSPILYTLDGNDQEVTHDTADNNNTFPLPTRVFDTNGDPIDPATDGSVNTLNSSVLSFQSDFNDYYSDFTARDLATETSLAALLAAFNAEDFATQTTLNALLTAFNAEDFATQTTLNSLLTAFNAEDFSSETTLAALLAAFNAEDFATEATLDGLRTDFSNVDFSTEAKQDVIITALADLLSELQQKTEPTDTQPVDSVQLPGSLGQKAMAQSLAVVLASDQSSIPAAATQSGNWSVRTQDGSGNALSSESIGSNRALHQKALGGAYADSAVKASGSVTSAAWTQLIASTAAECQGITVFDSSGVSVEIGVGAAASEARVLVVPPGGLNGFIPLRIPAGSRVSIKAISTTADYTSAEHILNLLG